MKRIADYDSRHFRFERTSGLPRDYFDERRRVSVDSWVLWSVVALGVATIALIAMGVIQW